MKHRKRGYKGLPEFSNSFERDYLIPQNYHTIGHTAVGEATGIAEVPETTHLSADFKPQEFLISTLIEMRQEAQPVSYRWMLMRGLDTTHDEISHLDQNDRAWLDNIRDAAVSAGVYIRITKHKDNGRRDIKFIPGPVIVSGAVRSPEFVEALQRPIAA